MSYNLVDPTTGDLTRVAGNSNIVDTAIETTSTWSSSKIYSAINSIGFKGGAPENANSATTPGVYLINRDDDAYPVRQGYLIVSKPRQDYDCILQEVYYFNANEIYSRGCWFNSWYDWQQLATTDSTLKTIQLSGSVDCNTLTEPGLYTASAGAVSALTNTPANIGSAVQLAGGFSILVTKTNVDGVYYGMQMFIPYGSDLPFMRKSYYLNGQYWTPWEQLATKSDLPKLVNKTYTTDEAGAINLMYQPGTVINVYVNRNDGKEYDITQWIYNDFIYVKVSNGGVKITGEIPLSIFTIGV